MNTAYLVLTSPTESLDWLWRQLGMKLWDYETATRAAEGEGVAGWGVRSTSWKLCPPEDPDAPLQQNNSSQYLLLFHLK